MTKNWLYMAVVCCAIFHNFPVVQNAMTQKAAAFNEYFYFNNTAQYLKLKKDNAYLFKSDLCRKCLCSVYTSKIDCRFKSMTEWFSYEEWNMLKNSSNYFETIDLQYNNITNIPQLGTYPVKHLLLGHNMITDIAIGAFGNLTELITLDLSGNKITSNDIVPDVFRASTNYSSTLPHLRVLNLGENQLRSLDEAMFKYFPNLEELILRNNSINSLLGLATIIDYNLHFFKTLDVSYMKLQRLPISFLYAQKLETLTLTGNFFKAIPKQANSVKRLILDENPIRYLSKTTERFAPGPGILEYLSISNMPELKHISDGAFERFLNLTELEIANNPKLSSIDANAFKKGTNYTNEFERYPPLKTLNLYGNNLKTLEHGVHVQWADIEYIYLGNNPWKCDCTNSWLINELMRYINDRHTYLTYGVNCHSPRDLYNVPLIDLYIKQTKLTCDTSYETPFMYYTSDKTPSMYNTSDESDTGYQKGDISTLVMLSVEIGAFMGILLTLCIVVLYQRNCFGLCDRSDTSDKRLENEQLL